MLYIFCFKVNALLCYTVVSVLVLGIGIARGQYYWILDIGCLVWCRSNPSEKYVFYSSVCVWSVVVALGSCAHIASLERTAHGDLTTDMCIPAFQWTVDAVLEAIQRYAELLEFKSDMGCT